MKHQPAGLSGHEIGNFKTAVFPFISLSLVLEHDGVE
jgi:hypothetical protein